MDLPSHYLLMATRDRTGKPMGWHHHGFGGAVLGELALQDRLDIERKRLVATGDAPHDPLLRFVWHEIHDRSRPKKTAWWVSRLSGRGYRLLRRQWTQRLVDQGILRHEKQSILGLVPLDRYPSNGTGQEVQLRESIKQAVAHRDTRDPRLVCLVTLLCASDGLSEVAQGSERRAIKKQAKAWMKTDPWGKAVSEIVAGIMAAVVASTIAASAVGS